MVERDAPRFATADRHLFTPGIRLARDASDGAVDYHLEATWQTGRARRTTAATDRVDLDVSAWFLHLEAGYRFAGGGSPRVALQYDLGTGDRGRAGKFNRFDSLFGVRREYGPTDLYGLYQRTNISSPAIRVEVTPGKATDAYASYRAGFLESRVDAFAASGVRDQTGSSGRFAGHQLEAGVTHRLFPDRVTVSAAAVYLAKGRFLERAPNAPATGETLYGVTDVTFSF